MELEEHSLVKVGPNKHNRRDILKLGARAGIGVALGQACLSCSSKSMASPFSFVLASIREL